MYLEEIGAKAKAASRYMARCSQELKNKALLKVAEDLIKNQETIIAANKIDIENAKANGMSEALLDRLTLTSDRFDQMADGIRQVVQL